MSLNSQTFADTAEQASEKALSAVFSALDHGRNFKLEAGAGAGKTYSLIQALKYILERRGRFLPRTDQRVACLTYTKVARDEINARTDGNPAIFADTLHGFLWEMISPYQKSLAALLSESEVWRAILSGDPNLDGFAIDYDLGIRGVHEDRVTLHHDDIPALAIELFGNKKFRSLTTDRFPIVFIDEYQDTPAGLGEAVIAGHKSDRISPVVGFFGDHWQQIYEKTCGSIENPTLTPIQKNANFRSDKSIVHFLNCLRPELPQSPQDDAGVGTVTIYHTNFWPGARLGRNWKGQISQEATQACLDWLQTTSASSVWIRESTDYKVLMLTHRTIANELGYPSLPGVFKYNDSFVKKENPVVEYLVDTIEPALIAFRERKYGDLFSLLGGRKPTLRGPKDKLWWSEFFDSLDRTSTKGMVGEVLDLIFSQQLFSVPTRVAMLEREFRDALSILEQGEALREPRKLTEFQALRMISYSETRALYSYLDDSTIFSTKHSVKGAEFDDVVVVAGRGWSKYDFAEMLSAYAPQSSPELKEANSFEPSRNLFYVSASRAKHNLALLFVQELHDDTLAVLSDWVGPENIVSIEFEDSVTPR